MLRINLLRIAGERQPYTWTQTILDWYDWIVANTERKEDQP